MSPSAVAFVGLLLLLNVSPAGLASAAPHPPRLAVIEIDAAHRLQPLQIDKVASLGRGGRPTRSGRAAPPKSARCTRV